MYHQQSVDDGLVLKEEGESPRQNSDELKVPNSGGVESAMQSKAENCQKRKDMKLNSSLPTSIKSVSDLQKAADVQLKGQDDQYDNEHELQDSQVQPGPLKL